VHTDPVDNSMKPRTQRAIALMSAGNLEGSWFYLLLSNMSVVKRWGDRSFEFSVGS
jgi:hypothetical protein